MSEWFNRLWGDEIGLSMKYGNEHEFWLLKSRVSSGYGPDRSASSKIGTGSKILTMVITMVFTLEANIWDNCS